MRKDQIAHDFSELPNAESLPLEEWGLPKNWGLCVIGNSLKEQGVSVGSLCIQIYEENDDDLITHYYPVPRSVSMFLNFKHRQGIKEAQSDIKRALGIQ